MSRNAPISVHTRSKYLTRCLVSIGSSSRSNVHLIGGMGREPDCEQLLFRYVRRSEHLRGARGRKLRCKYTVNWGNILPPQCSASIASWVFATTNVHKQKLLAVRFSTHYTKRYTRTTGTFD